MTAWKKGGEQTRVGVELRTGDRRLDSEGGLDVEEAFHWRIAIRCFVSAHGFPRIEGSTHASQGRGSDTTVTLRSVLVIIMALTSSGQYTVLRVEPRLLETIVIVMVTR